MKSKTYKVPILENIQSVKKTSITSDYEESIEKVQRKGGEKSEKGSTDQDAQQDEKGSQEIYRLIGLSQIRFIPRSGGR